jgi:phosphoribosylformimino-5-aminoimidazole carboxamide ribotide isomerase
MDDFAVIPAVDIKCGKAVRLLRGRPEETFVFDDDPVAAARRWEAEGAPMLHVVDLDGAFAGEPINADVIKEIARTVSVPVQVGGGIRDTVAARDYVESRVARIVVGTRAFTDLPWLREMAGLLGDRLVVGMDISDGRVAVAGWTDGTEMTPDEGLEMLEQAGVRRVVYTDVSRDGTLEGPNFDGLRSIATAASIPVIASGGVGGVEDVVRIWKMRDLGIEGVIVGMALYRGKITLGEITRALEEGAEG